MKDNIKIVAETLVKKTENPLMNICMIEQEKAHRRKKVNIITSYLLTALQISPSSNQLVLVLAQAVNNNNREAFALWVSERLETIDFEDHNEWKRALSLFLTDVYC